jgi:ubiquitin-activating enzyme E1
MRESVYDLSVDMREVTAGFWCSMESLPDELPSEDELKPVGSRYDSQIAVFGRSLQARLAALRVFLVGAGALGCEFLKNFALMGVAASDVPAPPMPPSEAACGCVTVTDDDVIEKSNLSRQFLFRDWDIGGFKAAVAGAAAKQINPAFSAQLMQNRVSVDTEVVFNDDFWQSIDLVVNALDNVNARLYVDSRCVYFQKALLESGTLGTKCNTQVCIQSQECWTMWSFGAACS